MTFHEIEGDLFDPGHVNIGHGVNVDGVMGAGIAKEFRQRYPQMYAQYVKECRAGFSPGDVMTWRSGGDTIFNIASQDRPGANADILWLLQGVERSLDYILSEGLNSSSLYLPRIGCGIGGLKYSDVRLALYLAFNHHPIDLLIVTPEGQS